MTALSSPQFDTPVFMLPEHFISSTTVLTSRSLMKTVNKTLHCVGPKHKPPPSLPSNIFSFYMVQTTAQGVILAAVQFFQVACDTLHTPHTSILLLLLPPTHYHLLGSAFSSYYMDPCAFKVQKSRLIVNSTPSSGISTVVSSAHLPWSHFLPSQIRSMFHTGWCLCYI